MKPNQDRPKRFDEEIDVALKMLSETAPPAAMESRIHQSLEVATARLQRAKFGRVFWIPAAGTPAVVVLLLAFSLGHWRTEEQGQAVEIARTIAPMPASMGIAAGRPALVPAVTSREQKPAMRPVAMRHSRRKYSQYRHAANLLSYPLTGQEKLLIQFGQTASPTDLQALNPDYQAKVEAQQNAEFAAYVKSCDAQESAETNLSEQE